MYRMTDTPLTINLVKHLTRFVDVKIKETEELNLKLSVAQRELDTLRVELRKARVQQRCSFKRFKDARIRREVGTHIVLKDICRAYKQWMEEYRQNGEKNLNGNELETVICEEYGEPTDKKTFKHMRLFYDNDAVKQFDKETGLGEDSGDFPGDSQASKASPMAE
jgi:hypothetical protein